MIAYIPKNESTECVLVASKQTVLAVYVEKTKHIFMSRKQNAGKHQNIHTENVSFVSVAKLKYVGTTVKIKIKYMKKFRADNSGNACYQSVKNLPSSNLLSKNINIKVYRTIILPFENCDHMG